MVLTEVTNSAVAIARHDFSAAVVADWARAFFRRVQLVRNLAQHRAVAGSLDAGADLVARKVQQLGIVGSHQ